MKLELSAEKFRATTVNLIDTGDGIVLKRGRLQIKIGGEGAAKIVNFILGMAQKGISREEILAPFPAENQESVGALVDHLIGRRILVPDGEASATDDAHESQTDIFYWHFGTQTEEVREKLNGRRIRIFGVNYISRQLAKGLEASGATEFEVVDVPQLRNEVLFDEAGKIRPGQWQAEVSPYEEDLDPESMGCLVVTSDSGAIEQLRAWNEFCVLHRLQYLPVMLQDLVGYVGPLVIPGQTACFECARARQNAHLFDYRSRRAVEAAFLHGQSVGGFHPSMASILGDIAALELTKHFGLGGDMARAGTLIEVNLVGSEMKAHRVLKLPRCTVCSRLNRVPSTAFTKAMLLGPDREDAG